MKMPKQLNYVELTDRTEETNRYTSEDNHPLYGNLCRKVDENGTTFRYFLNKEMGLVTVEKWFTMNPAGTWVKDIEYLLPVKLDFHYAWTVFTASNGFCLNMTPNDFVKAYRECRLVVKDFDKGKSCELYYIDERTYQLVTIITYKRSAKYDCYRTESFGGSSPSHQIVKSTLKSLGIDLSTVGGTIQYI
jgi:hypothetical protein